MSPTRRDFLRRSLIAASAPALAASAPALAASGLTHAGNSQGQGFRKPELNDLGQPSAAPKKLKLLILGGTAFLGPHLIEAAQARGHEITLFNRGRTNTHLFPELEKLVGDRDPNKGEGLNALQAELTKGRRWDAVIDTSSYVPRITQASADLLRDGVDHYQFISTLSVFADRSVDVDEDSPVGVLDDPSIERVTGASYGPLKALCEQAAEKSMAGRVSNVRPGLIVGPMDRSDRFTWWPERVRRGGEILAPGKPDAPVQIIDVRDLAAWCIAVIENNTTGVYNAVGPKGRMTMQEFLHGCKIVIGSEASFTWASDEILAENKVRAYLELPLWLPREGAPYGTAQCQKAIAAGLRYRPVGDTIRDTLAWSMARDSGHKWRAGLAVEKELEILASLHQKSGGLTKPEHAPKPVYSDGR
jgi:nucleoside-diphosphate-sugar epimerase